MITTAWRRLATVFVHRPRLPHHAGLGCLPVAQIVGVRSELRSLVRILRIDNHSEWLTGRFKSLFACRFTIKLEDYVRWLCDDSILWDLQVGKSQTDKLQSRIVVIMAQLQVLPRTQQQG
jgi:hypothetical protein